MPQTGLRAPPDSLSFASLPKGVRIFLSNSLRQVFLLVLLHPTRAGCLNGSFESPFTILSCVVSKPLAEKVGTPYERVEDVVSGVGADAIGEHGTRHRAPPGGRDGCAGTMV